MIIGSRSSFMLSITQFGCEPLLQSSQAPTNCTTSGVILAERSQRGLAGDELTGGVTRRIPVERALAKRNAVADDIARGVAVGREVLRRDQGEGAAIDADPDLAGILQVRSRTSNDG